MYMYTYLCIYTYMSMARNNRVGVWVRDTFFPVNWGVLIHFLTPFYKMVTQEFLKETGVPRWRTKHFFTKTNRYLGLPG